MPDAQPTAKYLVLNHAIPAVYKERLLGCVVNDVVDPANGLQPDFALPEDDSMPQLTQTASKPSISDYDRLKSTMKGFLVENLQADPKDAEKFKNQVNLRDLLTERSVEGELSVDGSLTKLLKAHYGSSRQRNFEIEAATGKRYHLHNAIFEFKKRLWSNKYYRDRIYEIIEQKRDDGTLETLNKFSRKYNTIKSPRHKCEVIILPMIVGILTCEEIKINHLDNRDRQHGAAVTVPVDQAAGIQTNGALDVGVSYEASNTSGNHTAETIPDEVIVAVAYDLIAISTGKPDPHDPSHNQPSIEPSQSGFFSKLFGRGTSPSPSKICPACEENNLPYAAAWRHCPIRSNYGLQIGMPGLPDAKTSNDDNDVTDEHEVELADLPLELYIAPHSDHYILAEDLDPRLSPSSTGSTTRSSAGVKRADGSMAAVSELTDKAAEMNLGKK